MRSCRWYAGQGTFPRLRFPGRMALRRSGFRGELDFSLIGILARISDILARQEIGIFVVSTYNTDYVLTKGAQFDQALKALEEEGYQVCPAVCS